MILIYSFIVTLDCKLKYKMCMFFYMHFFNLNKILYNIHRKFLVQQYDEILSLLTFMDT